MSVSETAPPSHRRALKLAARIGLFVFSLALAVVGSEVVARLAAPQPASWMDIFARRAGLPFFVLAPNLDETAVTGETHWRVLTDDQGRRFSGVPQAAESKPDAKLAYALGDSFTFGNGVNYADCFVGLLDAEDPDHRWINLAVPAHGPAQYRMLLEEAIRQGPTPERVLVVTFLGNDFYDCVWNKNLPVRNGIIGDPGGLKSILKRNSHLYRLCAKIWHLFGDRADDMGSDELYRSAAWETGKLSRAHPIYRDEFAKLSALCKSHGIDLFACVIPTNRSVAGAADGGPSSKAPEPLDLTLPARKARAVFEELGIPFVDVSPELANLGAQQAYFRFDGHLTPAGNRIVARCVADHWPAISPKAVPSGSRPDSPPPASQPSAR